MSDRRVEIVVIEAEGRDKGKAFRIEEMSAWDAERWSTRALMALTRTGADIPVHAIRLSMAAIAHAGFSALTDIKTEEVEPILDRLMQCVTIIPDPKRPAIFRALIGDDISEVMTIWRLRNEVFRLHVGFSVADALSTSLASAQNGTAE